jgi:F-type H+-transporting ATPase subunit delta
MAKPGFQKAAAVYAKTLLELAREKGVLDALREEVAALREVFAKTPGLRRALQLPALSGEKKALLIRPISEKAPEILKRLLRLLEIKGRLSLLSPLCEEFLRLDEESRQVKRARVVSAVALSEAQLQSLAQGLAKRRPGKTYLLRNEVDPALIAGFRVEEDDFVTDASIRHKLNALRQRLVAA